jgi:microsomal epoxide hydrolase
MLYWLPNSIYSASRLYWESPVAATGRVVAAGRVTVPTGYARFGGSPTRELVEPHYNLVHYSEPARGGHFAALEEPELFADDVTRFFASRLDG